MSVNLPPAGLSYDAVNFDQMQSLPVSSPENAAQLTSTAPPNNPDDISPSRIELLRNDDNSSPSPPELMRSDSSSPQKELRSLGSSPLINIRRIVSGTGNEPSVQHDIPSIAQPGLVSVSIAPSQSMASLSSHSQEQLGGIMENVQGDFNPERRCFRITTLFLGIIGVLVTFPEVWWEGIKMNNAVDVQRREAQSNYNEGLISLCGSIPINDTCRQLFSEQIQQLSDDLIRQQMAVEEEYSSNKNAYVGISAGFSIALGFSCLTFMYSRDSVVHNNYNANQLRALRISNLVVGGGMTALGVGMGLSGWVIGGPIAVSLGALHLANGIFSPGKVAQAGGVLNRGLGSMCNRVSNCFSSCYRWIRGN